MLCLRFLDVLRTHAADSSRKFKVAYETAQHLLRHWYLLFVVNTGSKTDGEYEVQESCTRCCPIQRMYLGFPLYLGPSLWNGSSKDHCSISSPSIDTLVIFRCQQVTGLEALWMPHGPDQGAGPMVSGT